MKRFFAALTVFALAGALVFSGCDLFGKNAGEDDNEDVIGIWTGTKTDATLITLTLEISKSTWSAIFPNEVYTGTWTRNENVLTFEREGYYDAFAIGTLSQDAMSLKINHGMYNYNDTYTYIGTYTLTKKVTEKTDGTGTTREIKNESSVDINAVLWNNTAFDAGEYEDTIKPGTNVTKTVKAGGGYIHFKRKGNAIAARTQENVIVEADQKKAYTFTDNTVIVEKNNENNTGILKSLQSTVIWFDDAEGDWQNYSQSLSYCGYYEDGTDLGILHGYNNGGYERFNTPKNGAKSLAVGGTNTAKLEITINLEKAAKLSFWHANKFGGGTNGSKFSVNGTQDYAWTTDTNWAKREVNLPAGQTTLVWEKQDGYSSGGSGYYYWLTLDDILIYHLHGRA